MLRRFTTWLTGAPARVVVLLTVIATLFGVSLVIACSTQPSKLNTAERDLCKARADWKVIALAAGGKLDPLPGSPRAELEQDEDALCAVVPVPVAVAADAGS